MTNHSRIQEIRRKLYLLRDGASSASMRNKGLAYKMNWGVPVTALRKLADDYYPDNELAHDLWEQSTRELKILATMIAEPSQLSDINEWTDGINTIELAEQAVMNLFSKLPDAPLYATRWIQSEDDYLRLTGYLLYTRLFIQGIPLRPEDEAHYFENLPEALNYPSLNINNRALNSLLYLIRLDDTYLESFNEWMSADTNLSDTLKETIYQILQAEFGKD